MKFWVTIGRHLRHGGLPVAASYTGEERSMLGGSVLASVVSPFPVEVILKRSEP